MRAVDLIRKKREGMALSAGEISYLIQGYCLGDIPDYQMSAWAMAVCFQGMSKEETANLTMAMASSGDQVDLSLIQGIKVDKHSTGGVGDTTTLVLAPLVAAAGVPVAKMSGRGLGHTGGTIDKLDSIPGFISEQTTLQFIQQVNRCGIALISQSANITPADKKLYGLRDVTATVNSIPLIASSIMSKKIASGADAIVLDVKTGQGAFMKTYSESAALAQAMVEIGEQVGRDTIAVISSMAQPLGKAVGNALEVKEAISTLQGTGPSDLVELCLDLGSHMLILGKKAQTYAEAKQVLKRSLHNGSAYHKFKQWIAEQGGDLTALEYPNKLPEAKQNATVISGRSGWISNIKAEDIGLAAMLLGAGRETKDSAIDLSAGILLNKKVGDWVSADESLAELHSNDLGDDRVKTVELLVREAFSMDDKMNRSQPLILAVVTKEGINTIK